LGDALSKPAPAPYPSLHPNLVGLYKRKVAALEEALADSGIRAEAGEVLRSLIDRIEIAPTLDQTDGPDGYRSVSDVECPAQSSGGVAIILYGELASIIGLVEEKGAAETKRRFSLVAGARFVEDPTITKHV
jgi:hypothetical protein